MPKESKLVWPDADRRLELKSFLQLARHAARLALAVGLFGLALALILVAKIDVNQGIELVGLGIVSGIGIAFGQFIWRRLLSVAIDRYLR